MLINVFDLPLRDTAEHVQPGPCETRKDHHDYL
jgi:hypothetical protein